MGELRNIRATMGQSMKWPYHEQLLTKRLNIEIARVRRSRCIETGNTGG